MGHQDARIRNRAERLARRAGLDASGATTASSLLDLLESEVRGAPGPPLRPRRAAALIVLDREGRRPRVLMGRRNPKLAFMGGKFVFPGGRADAADRRMLARLGAGAGQLGAPAGSAMPAIEALALAAVRETFEETGYLIGARRPLAAANAPAPWREFTGEGVTPCLDGIHFVARALTPPGGVRRFDTAFLCAEASRIAGVKERKFDENAELVEIAWIALDELETYPLPAITRVVAQELLLRLERGLQAAGPAPFYRQIRGRWRRDEL